MSAQYTLKVGMDKAKEMPMVDLAFEVLRAANTPFYYRDLMAEISKIKGLSEEAVMQVIAQLYTEINIDGRFACVGSNLWGLKRWYPIEKSEDTVGSGKRPRIINDEDDDMDDDDMFAEEEDVFVEEEDFDSFDKPAEEDFEAEEEIEEEGEFLPEEEIDDDDDSDDEDLDEEDGDLETDLDTLIEEELEDDEDEDK